MQQLVWEGKKKKTKTSPTKVFQNYGKKSDWNVQQKTSIKCLCILESTFGFVFFFLRLAGESNGKFSLICWVCGDFFLEENGLGSTSEMSY